jgi:para-nitrobenzyl esterase
MVGLPGSASVGWAGMHREMFGRRVTVIVVAVMMLIAGCARPDGGQGTTGAQPPADPALIQTATGAVRGLVTPEHRLFAGIPYAAPPVGPLRWEPPAPVKPWPGVRNATHTGPRCMQDATDLEMGRQTAEDCLTLNVWTPPPSERKRAVMVWIHGGAFVNGSSGLYDSRWLVSRGDVVVVTLNYRLGALGFLAHPAWGAPGARGH